MKSVYLYIIGLSVIMAAVSCRHDIVINTDPNTNQTSEIIKGNLVGMYLLNEGNMGSNKATLDYLDFTTGVYTQDIYAQRNPSVVKELGDVGNDLQIYGSKLYAVINASNKIEVMTADSAKRIGQIDVPNCRKLAFCGRYGYVTSYAGPIVIDSAYKQIGYVMRFDTASLQPIDTCYVGFQPEGLAVCGNNLYVANSGGYMVPKYDSTLSVIDITSFTETKRMTIAHNMQHVIVDRHNHLWVNSLGDYYNEPSRIYCIDATTNQIITTLDVAVSNMFLAGDSLYYYSAGWDYVSMQNTIGYGIIDVAERKVVNTRLITDGTAESIEMPYGIVVNPVNNDFYITDALSYVIPGWLYCFNSEGQQKWKTRTGDIPAHMAFLYK